MVEGGTLIQNDKTPCIMEFVFDEYWGNFTNKIVLFKAGNAAEVSVGLDKNECLIPDECLKEGGVFLKTCVQGSSNTGDISTAWYTLGRVLYDATIDIGGDSHTPTDPGAYDELKKAIGDIFELQTESKTLVGAVNELKQAINNGGGSFNIATDEEVNAMLYEVFGNEP